MATPSPVTLLVDAGGTRTRLARLAASGGLRAPLECRVEGGPGNVGRQGVEAVARDLRELAGSVLAEGEEVAQLAGGFAGCGSAPVAAQLRDALAVAFGMDPSSVQVTSDLHCAWLGATAGEAGVLLLAGTGSAAYGRESGGGLVPFEGECRAGGLGPAFDDPGSGYWLGRLAVRQLLGELDGRLAVHGLASRELAADGLAACVLAELGLGAEELPGAVRAGELTVERVAGLARLVLDRAREGDALCREWRAAAARELAGLARAVLGRLPAGARVHFSGGLLESCPELRREVGAALSRGTGSEVQLEAPLGDALEGAALLLGVTG